MGWIGKGTAFAVATLGLVVMLGGTAGADPQPKVRPELECVFKVSDTEYVAVYGYDNESGAVGEIPFGPNNKFNGKTDLGQPTTFEVGRQYNVFQVTFDGKNMTWTLTGGAATASDTSDGCKEPPVPVGTGSAQSFLWIGLVAAILVVGSGGTAWSLRRRLHAA